MYDASGDMRSVPLVYLIDCVYVRVQWALFRERMARIRWGTVVLLVVRWIWCTRDWLRWACLVLDWNVYLESAILNWINQINDKQKLYLTCFVLIMVRLYCTLLSILTRRESKLSEGPTRWSGFSNSFTDPTPTSTRISFPSYKSKMSMCHEKWWYIEVIIITQTCELFLMHLQLKIQMLLTDTWRRTDPCHNQNFESLQKMSKMLTKIASARQPLKTLRVEAPVNENPSLRMDGIRWLLSIEPQ